MTAVLDEPTLEQHLARINDEGFTIIEDAVEPELVVVLRDTIGWRSVRPLLFS